MLISAYAIATAGFTLMPGVDDQGNPWRLSVFEAFYVVSYTGSTIGFGESTVSVLARPAAVDHGQYLPDGLCLAVFHRYHPLLCSKTRHSGAALRRARFRRAIRGLSQPFYLVCGYGDTGADAGSGADCPASSGGRA